MRYWKQCLQAPLLQLSLGFRGTFLDPLSWFSSLFWRLEQAILIVKRLIGLEPQLWWWSSLSNRLISRYQLEGSKLVGRLTSSFKAMHAGTHQRGPTSVSLSSRKEFTDDLKTKTNEVTLKGLCHGSRLHFVLFCQLLALNRYGTENRQRNYI